MRRRKLGILICLSLSFWAFATYFLFVLRPSISKEDESNSKSELKYQPKLEALETQIKNFINKNKNVVNSIRNRFINLKNKNLFISKLKSIVREEDIVKNNDLPAEPNHADNASYQGKGDIVNNFDTDGEQDINKVPSQEFELKTLAQTKLENGGPVIAVLVFSCNRVTVSRNLDQLIKWRPSKQQFPIIVSQDCSHQATTDVIQSYGDELFLIRQPDQSDIPVPPKEKKFKGYFKIARHYGWALNQTFKFYGFDTTIIVEDDLDIASDFFEYFLGTYWLLKHDKTLWCVSAWNDNGKRGLIDETQPQLLHRTDFFPGLGWMLTSSLWDELNVKWPQSYWDDWMRQPEQRKDRACIRPELPRSKTFGKVGVSNGLFYEKHLKYIQLNEKFIGFTQLNLSYLLKDNYDVKFVKEVYESPVVSYQELRSGSVFSEGPVRIPYHTKDQYKKTAKMLGLMDEYRSGVPRTAYRGVVSFYYKGRRVFLAPSANWKNYDPTWS